MKVSGDRTFAASRDTVWDVLNDPAQMAELMPGVESFDVHDERRWRANVKIPLGLGGLRLSINFEKLDERAPGFARLHAKGTGVGALMDLDTQFHLDERDGGTAMHWEADVRIAGPVGGMGQRVLQPIVNQQVQHVLTALDQQVQRAATGDRPEETGAEAGISPLAEEGYSEDPQGPTQHTGEPRE
jgi:carbon monoxide dehydrogenase subunit G